MQLVHFVFIKSLALYPLAKEYTWIDSNYSGMPTSPLLQHDRVFSNPIIITYSHYSISQV